MGKRESWFAGKYMYLNQSISDHWFVTHAYLWLSPSFCPVDHWTFRTYNMTTGPWQTPAQELYAPNSTDVQYLNKNGHSQTVVLQVFTLLVCFLVLLAASWGRYSTEIFVVGQTLWQCVFSTHSASAVSTFLIVSDRGGGVGHWLLLKRHATLLLEGSDLVPFNTVRLLWGVNRLCFLLSDETEWKYHGSADRLPELFFRSTRHGGYQAVKCCFKQQVFVISWFKCHQIA